MTTYTPPIHDMLFVLQQVVSLTRSPRAADLDAETVEAVLEKAGKLARDVLAPLNHTGDETGSKRGDDGSVKTPPGFREAYAQYRDGGWNAVPFSPDHGGQGLPWALGFAVQEMWQSANMSFGLCPLLNQGAVEAIENHGSQQLKDLYLEKLIAGEWTGTMNLTEPQAGSDLSAIRTRAEPQADGTYKIFGQKIFITYGEHDFAENIIHLVLARTPNAPEGVKEISLFVVPKFLPDGSRNDLLCTSIEHKLGIHASPTCTMQYGDKGGAIGMLVGTENEGIKYMFTMMNNARLCVGLQGVAIAERAYQAALAYAKDRVQSRPLDGRPDRVAIIEHADVSRMLMHMRVLIESARALTYEAAINLDLARAGDAAAQARVDLLTPIVKSWSTDMAVEVTSLGVQIHGGMGFIEETGAAQFFRDARILPIYEGTNGIQANDLVFRKVLKDGGTSAQAWFAHIESVCTEMNSSNSLSAFAQDLRSALQSLQQSTQNLLALGKSGKLDDAAFVAQPYLRSFAIVSCGMMSGLSALRESDDGPKHISAEFFRTHILPLATTMATITEQGRNARSDQKYFG